MENKKLIEISETLNKYDWIKSLQKAGGRLYIVGGIVRDVFLEKESKDIDLVVENMSINNIKDILSKFGKTVENNVGDNFKVLKFRPKGWAGELFDIATPRKDVKVSAGHKGFLTMPVKSINEDLRRRDFTINSMAFDIESNKLLDLFNGRRDIKKGIIKATDKNAFVEDPLRLMRAIQFAARFEFDIANKTKSLMKTHAHKITEIKGERILEELEKIIKKKGSTEIAFRLMDETDLDSYLLGSKLYSENLRDLDDLSFFYILSSIGGNNPKKFYMERFKGKSEMGKELDVLNNLLKLDVTVIDDNDLRYEVFMAIKKAPNIRRSHLLPIEIDEILIKMANNIIPTTSKDIQISGKDVERIVGVKGIIVGTILDKLIRESLSNKIDWKNHSSMLNELNRV